MTVPGSGDIVTIPENSPQVLLAEEHGNATTIAGLTFSGAMEMRTGLIVMGPMSWTKGALFADGAQDTHLQVQGVSLSGQDAKSLHGNIDVENSGVLNWSGGDIIATTDPVGRPSLATTGTVNLNDDVSFHTNFSPDPQFICNGTLRKQGGTGTSTIGDLTAFGTVEIDTGTVALDRSGSIGGRVTLAAGTNLSVLALADYTLVDATITGAGTLSIGANGTLRYSGNVTVQNLSLVTNGLLTVPSGQMANLAISGSMDWTGGTISGGHVTFNGALTIHGADDKFLTNCVLDNAGLATWMDAGAIVEPAVSLPVVWNNLASATLDIQNQAPFVGPAGNVSFFNAGTVRKSAATDTGLAIATFSNSGLLDLAAGGTLNSSATYHGQRYVSRDFFWQAGASDTGTGTVFLSSPTKLTVAGDGSVPNLTLTAGATITGAATLTVHGLFSWTGGTLTGTGTLLANGGVTISGSDSKVITGWTIDNAALAVWTGSGGITGTNATWNNLPGSVFQDGATGQLAGNGGGGTASTHFNNAGTYEATITAPLYHLLDVLFDNSGTVQADPGQMLSIFDSMLTMEDGSSESGGGSLLVAGTTQFNVMGNTTVENVTFQADGDTVSGSGTLTTTGLLHFDGGTLANGHIQFVGLVSIGANFFSLSLTNFTFDNAGTVTWTGNSVISLDSASIWNNLPGSLFDAQGDGTMRMSPIGNPKPQFNNAGTFRKSAGTGTASLQQVTFTNTGSVEVLSGTLDLLGDFPNFSGNTLTGGSYFVHSTLRFPNADIRTNAATIVLDGPAASIRDTSFPSNDALANFMSNTGAGAFTVHGNRTFATPHDFTNAGTVVVADTSTLQIGGTYEQSNGFTVLSGGTLTAANLVDIEGGELDGFGTISGNVLNAAMVNVGGPLNAGILTINGDFTQTAAADLLVQIGGPSAGTDFSQLNVSGQATLDGTLTVTLINGFVPNAGDSFEVLTFSSASGAFATLDGDGPLFGAVYDAGGLTLVKN
jgi:hypothetical protein